MQNTGNKILLELDGATWGSCAYKEANEQDGFEHAQNSYTKSVLAAWSRRWMLHHDSMMWGQCAEVA